MVDLDQANKTNGANCGILFIKIYTPETMVNNLNFKCVGKPLKSFEQNFSLIQFKWRKKKTLRRVASGAKAIRTQENWASFSWRHVQGYEGSLGERLELLGPVSWQEVYRKWLN